MIWFLSRKTFKGNYSLFSTLIKVYAFICLELKIIGHSNLTDNLF